MDVRKLRLPVDKLLELQKSMPEDKRLNEIVLGIIAARRANNYRGAELVHHLQETYGLTVWFEYDKAGKLSYEIRDIRTDTVNELKD